MTTVMVTGGAGFLGSTLCRLFAERGDDVVVFDQRPGPNAPRIRTRIGPVHDLSALVRAIRDHGVRRIVHTVAILDGEENPYATYLTNVMGAINVIEAVRLERIERAVLISSEAAYHATEQNPMNEDHRIFRSSEGSPGGHYGASKAAADLIALTYASQNGLDLRVVRLSSLYGPGMSTSMYIRPMVEGVVAGRPVRFESGGDMRRDYTYYLDAAQGVMRALDADPARLEHRVFNIASGRTVTVSELAEIVRRVEPQADITVGPGLTGNEASLVRTRGTLDLSCAERELGYRPEYPLERGVRVFIDALREGERPSAR
ncbi:MAG: NAD(P)-dependent oxidoreductase [Chloroflexi bacterium]|nr:NAD(P)-dependent oxidoreductase [Chloroflexota bacterium]